VFSIASFIVLAFYGIDAGQPHFFARYSRFSVKYAATYAVIALAGAYGVSLYHDAKKEGLTGVATRVVEEYFNLPTVKTPSLISPFMTAKATEKFEDAPIQVIEYADFRCPDCLLLTQQLSRLKQEFKGKINIAYQFFPLEAKCNDVVSKNLHPGACELAYIAAKDPVKFVQVHDEIFENFAAGRNPQWRLALAKKYNAESAANDPAIKDLVYRVIQTGREYEKTSDQFQYGIRSTPTMILNNRMVIGTLPYGQLKAIFQALVAQRDRGTRRSFMENWVPTK
jgi:protein-disulfide isomerase